jgi:hypothetical protein
MIRLLATIAIPPPFVPSWVKVDSERRARGRPLGPLRRHDAYQGISLPS